MKALKITLTLVAAIAISACAPKSGGSGSAKSSGRSGRGGNARAEATPEPQRSVTRASSSANPQAVAAFKDGVKLLEKIRKDGSGSYDAAITRFEGAVSLDGEFAEAWYNLGVIYEDLGRYDKAESSFSRAVRANPKLGEAAASLGRIYLLRGNTAKAKEFYNDQLEKDSKNKEIRNKLADIYRLEKNFNAALEQIKQVLFVDSDNVEAYKTLALVFMDQGKWDMAKMTCANALKIDPENASIYNNLGLIYLKEGDKVLAAAQFSKALEKDAGFAPALANLGAIALDHKDYVLAADSFGRLSKIKPSNVVALNAYAVALRGLGTDADALAKFHEDKGEEDPAKDKRKDAKKHYDDAKEAYMRVHSLDKDNFEVSYNLGVLHQRGYKDFKTAIRYYQDYIAKAGISDPGHKVYKNIKQCEDELKAIEMMNAPSPASTPEPPKEEPGDVAKDGKDASAPEGANKPKAQAPGAPAAGSN